jgi:hypothetical protein
MAGGCTSSIQLTHSARKRLAGFQPLKLKRDFLVSKFCAFECNLCRYAVAVDGGG